MNRLFHPQAKSNNQRGAATLMIVLIAVIVATMAVAALAIAPQLKRITEERKTVKRANVIVEAMKQYFLARGELPVRGSVPVTDLGLGQEYKLDSWGKEWDYQRATNDGGQTAASTTDITRMEYDGLRIAGVLISGGPDQQIGTTVTWDDSTDPLDPRLKVERPTTGPNAGIAADDIIISINVHGEAIQIAKDEIKRLTQAQCTYRKANYNWQLVLSDLINNAGLGETYKIDSWSGEYEPSTLDPGAEEFYFSSSNGEISGPVLTSSACGGSSAVPVPEDSWDAEDGSGTTVSDSPGRGDGADVAYDFTTDIYVDTGLNPSTTLTDKSFTVSLWAKPLTDNIGSSPKIVIGASDSSNNFALGIKDNKWYWELGDIDSDSPAPPADDLPGHIFNYWQHVVLIYDYDNGTDKKVLLYLNGEKKSEIDYSGNGMWPEFDLFLGAMNVNGTETQFFNGFIDDTAIWSQTLGDEQVRTLYWRATVARYLFAGDAEDASPWENHGVFKEDNATWSAPTFTADRFTESDKAVTFNGTNQWMDLGTGASLNFSQNNDDPNLIESGFSVGAWFKTSDSYGPLLSFRNSSHGGAVLDFPVGYDGAVDSAGNIMGLVRNDNEATAGYARATGGAVANGQWHYAVLSRGQNNSIVLYLDGAQAATGTGAAADGSITTNLRALASERYWINVQPWGNANQQWFAGDLDDVVIYPRNISIEEVKDEWCRFKTATSATYGATCP